MFSQTVEYSLRAAAALAARHNEPMTVEQISDAAHVPRPYLSKIMQTLVRADVVRSQRGRGGGFLLAHSPETITIWDIVIAVDPIKRIHTCPLEVKGHDTLCPLHRRIDRAIELIEQAFHDTSLQELIDECNAKSPLCTSPVAKKTRVVKKKQRRGAKRK